MSSFLYRQNLSFPSGCPSPLLACKLFPASHQKLPLLQRVTDTPVCKKPGTLAPSLRRFTDKRFLLDTATLSINGETKAPSPEKVNCFPPRVFTRPVLRIGQRSPEKLATQSMPSLPETSYRERSPEGQSPLTSLVGPFHGYFLGHAESG